MANTAELGQQLRAALAGRLGCEVEVTSLDRLTGGASRATWSLEARVDGVPRSWILQRERPGGVRTGTGMAGEAALLAAAGAAGVPVPRVVTTDGGGDDLGGPFVVVERLAGETIPRKLLRDDRFVEARGRVVRDAAVALARLHAMDPAPVVHALDRQDQIAQFRGVLDVLGEPHPTFELAFRWLELHPPPARPDAVVHGDFRTGNLVVDERGLVGVLDWELSHLGNPVEDLGWFCVRAWRFGSPHRAGGFGSADELLEAYAREGGAEVSLDELRWWEILGTLKWGVMCLVQSHTHLGGAVRSVELASIGRRASENEWDLLELIA